MGTILGDLDPSTVLVNSRASEGPSNWAPVLLVSWPPALQFWASSISSEQYIHLFPVAENLSENAFAAPETLLGRASERSDVYSLGAILYLLFTRYAPAAAALREAVEQTTAQHGGNQTWQPDGANSFGAGSGMALVPPHLFNSLISPRLERLLLRTLALSPEERFPSVFELVEALEAIDPAVEFVDHYEGTNDVRRDSRIMKALGRVRDGANAGRKSEG
jgi:serine/threonine protein kinase